MTKKRTERPTRKAKKPEMHAKGGATGKDREKEVQEGGQHPEQQ